MIEEEEIKQGEGASLHHDFAKFLTTLSLVALGGVLGLTEKIDPSLAKPVIVGFVAARSDWRAFPLCRPRPALRESLWARGHAACLLASI